MNKQFIFLKKEHKKFKNSKLFSKKPRKKKELMEEKKKRPKKPTGRKKKFKNNIKVVNVGRDKKKK